MSKRFDAPYRVRLTRETSNCVESMAAVLGLSQADVIRRLISVALTAPPPVMTAAGLPPQAPQ